MGQEVNCKLRLGKKVAEGRALLESLELIFRGPDLRLKIAFREMSSIEAKMSSWPMPGQLTRMATCVMPARCCATSASVTCAGVPIAKRFFANRRNCSSGAPARFSATPPNPHDA